MAGNLIRRDEARDLAALPAAITLAAFSRWPAARAVRRAAVPGRFRPAEPRVDSRRRGRRITPCRHTGPAGPIDPPDGRDVDPAGPGCPARTDAGPSRCVVRGRARSQRPRGRSPSARRHSPNSRRWQLPALAAARARHTGPVISTAARLLPRPVLGGSATEADGPPNGPRCQGSAWPSPRSRRRRPCAGFASTRSC